MKTYYVTISYDDMDGYPRVYRKQCNCMEEALQIIEKQSKYPLWNIVSVQINVR